MSNITRIIAISKPLYKVITAIAVLIVIGAVLELVSPIINKQIVDIIVNNLGNHSGNIGQLTFWVVLSFVVSLVGIALSSISDRMGDYYAGRVRKLLSEKYFEKVLTLSQKYFDSELSGKIINQLNRGIASIEEFVNAGTNFILPSILQSVFTLIVLAKYNVPIALLMLLLFPIYIYLTSLSTKQWGKEEEKKNKLEDSIRGRISEVISNIKVVKTFMTETKESRYLSKTYLDINKIYDRQSTTFHIYDFIRNFSLIVIVLIINIIAFYNTFNGLLTVGELVLILQLILQARRPLFAMSFILSRIQQAESGSKEFFEVLDLPSTEMYSQYIDAPKITDPTITFDHVYFSYTDSDYVLKDISLNFKPNETVALVGHSGVGKSTLINLILKFYDPIKGEILLNNKKYSQLSHAQVRNNIALVFQENELFSSTIADNVSYGTRVSAEEIKHALKLANAWDFVKKLPKGMNSPVGERGVKLSGGQKQRIQIARAILSNRPILILDEATSSLDSRSERLVQEGLTNLMADKLTIIIAHRFSTIQNVERIFVIDNGKIVDTGTPGELSKRPGIYADLLRYQLEGDKKLLEEFDIF